MLTCICIDSVRYWYPDIEVYLIKDCGKGDFDTSLLQQHWDVKIFSTTKKNFGWGYGKLDAFDAVKRADPPCHALGPAPRTAAKIKPLVAITHIDEVECVAH